MIELTQEERSILAQRVAYIISHCGEGVSWQEILMDAYCEFLPDKTCHQAELATDQLLGTMREFETMYDVARAEPQAFVRYYLHAATEGKTLEQQCRSLYSLVEGLEAFTAIGEKNPDTLWREDLRGKRYEGPVTEEARDALKARAAKLMAEASMTDHAMESIVSLLEEYPDQAHSVYDHALHDQAFRSLSAMVLYTMAKNRELRHVPETATLRQVTCAVCAEDSMRRLIGDVEKGYIDTIQYRAHRTAIWQVTQVMLVAGLVLLGGGAVAAAIAEEQIIGAVLAGFSALYGIALCIGPMDDTVQEIIQNEYVPINEETIPVYSNAEEVLSAYTPSGDGDHLPQLELVKKDQWQAMPDLLLEEL